MFRKKTGKLQHKDCEILRYHKSDEEKVRNWMEKLLHGWYISEVNQTHVELLVENGKILLET